VLEKPLNDVFLEGAIDDLTEAERYYLIEMGSTLLFERALSQAIEDTKLFPEAIPPVRCILVSRGYRLNGCRSDT
jgi:hypothetical protein